MGVSRKQSAPNFPKNLACFVYLKYPFLDSPFSLITDDLWEIFIVGNFWHILYKMCRVYKVLCNIAFCCIFFSFFWVFLFALYLKFLHYLNWWKTYFLQDDISANLTFFWCNSIAICGCLKCSFSSSGSFCETFG